MAMMNHEMTVCFTVWNTYSNTGVVGDAANLSIRIVLDGEVSVPTNEINEVDSIALPGIYSVLLTADEMNHNSVSLGGTSTTGNVIVVPIHITTEQVVGSKVYTDNIVHDDEPISGVAVEAYYDTDRLHLADRQFTDLNGIFTFYINPGTYYMRAVKPGYRFSDWIKVVTV